MIRADWTPLYAADWSTCKTLGRSQVACLEALRDRGEMTRRELIQLGISRRTLDKLVVFTYPQLVTFRGDHPNGRQRYLLAAPGQQEALEAVLAVIAAHPGGISVEQLHGERVHRRWAATAQDHILNAHLARYENRVYYPPAPGQPLSGMAEVIGRRMTVRWQSAAVPS